MIQPFFLCNVISMLGEISWLFQFALQLFDQEISLFVRDEDRFKNYRFK